MKELDEALAEITAIRSQIARSAEFHGYGPVTVATTGLMALVAGEVQAHRLHDPVNNIAAYIAVWMATAAFSIVLVGFEMVMRSRSMHSGLAEEMMSTTVEQLLPAGIAGVLLTAVLVRFSPDAVWMLPGLWQVLFSLGVFASARFLPRATYAVAGWYLLTGLACLALSHQQHVLSPWLMAIPFGVGQLLAAAVLQWSESIEDGRF